MEHRRTKKLKKRLKKEQMKEREGKCNAGEIMSKQKNKKYTFMNLLQESSFLYFFCRIFYIEIQKTQTMYWCIKTVCSSINLHVSTDTAPALIRGILVKWQKKKGGKGEQKVISREVLKKERRRQLHRRGEKSGESGSSLKRG